MDILPSNIVIDASELDALPGGSVIISNADDVGCIYAKWPEHHLASLYGPWYPTGYEVPCPSDEIPLPARLIWHPDWSG
jgi:hypothetical protein